MSSWYQRRRPVTNGEDAANVDRRAGTATVDRHRDRRGGRQDPQKGYPPGSPPERVYRAARRSVTRARSGVAILTAPARLLLEVKGRHERAQVAGLHGPASEWLGNGPAAPVRRDEGAVARAEGG